MPNRLARIGEALAGVAPAAGRSPLDQIAQAVAKDRQPVVQPKAAVVPNPQATQDKLLYANVASAWHNIEESVVKAEHNYMKPGQNTAQYGLTRLIEAMPPTAHAEIDLLQHIADASGNTKVQYWGVQRFPDSAAKWRPAESELQRLSQQATSKALGKKSPSYDLITVATKNERSAGELLVHEAMHAAVARFIDQNPTHAVVKQLGKLREIAIERATALHGEETIGKILNQKGDWDVNLYGLTDVHEFMSEVVSNPNFRAFLAGSEEVATADQTKWLKKGQAILDEITKLVAKILGIEKPETLLLLNKSFNVSKSLLDQAKRANTNRLAQLKVDAGLKSVPMEPKKGALNKQSLEELRNTIGAGGGRVSFGPQNDMDLVADVLDAKLPEGVTVNDLVKTYFGPKWNEATDLEVRLTTRGELRVDGHSPALDTMRTFSPDMKSVSHDWMKMNPKFKGTGYFKNVMKETVDLYEKMGVETINLDAGAENGAYTWLRLGFLPEDPAETAAVALSRLRIELRLAGEEFGSPAFDAADTMKAYLDISGDDRFVNQMLIEIAKESDVLKKALKTDNPMQKVMKGMPVWTGKLDLKDTEQMEIFNKYVGRAQD